jgi:hypothetical protein
VTDSPVTEGFAEEPRTVMVIALPTCCGKAGEDVDPPKLESPEYTAVMLCELGVVLE